MMFKPVENQMCDVPKTVRCAVRTHFRRTYGAAETLASLLCLTWTR
jgi:hypothetical protein